MNITKIEISNYKSIKEPIEINFSACVPTVLIGKNGSGKTNILEALSLIAEANEKYFGLEKKINFDYKIHLCLSEEEASLLLCDNIDIDKCTFVAYSGENMRVDRIESDYLVPFFEREVEEVQNVSKELKKTLTSYKKLLGYVASNEESDLPSPWYQISNSRRSLTNFEELSLSIQQQIEKADKIVSDFKKCISSKDNTLKFANPNYYYPLDSNFEFKLEYKSPEFAPFEKKYIQIDEEALKREIAEINNETQLLSKRINSLLKEIDGHIRHLNAALGKDEIGYKYNDTGFFRFVYEIQKCVGAKCSFLKNESDDFIFKDTETTFQRYRNDSSLTILKTYLMKVYEGSDKENLLDSLSSNNGFSLSDEAITCFESYLNSNRPDFEKEMYDKITVEKNGKESIDIFLHEHSGEKISLNHTSLGRRWYFTYYFTKNALEAGDLFLIDEPAATLHPLAQKEVAKELFYLQNQGIRIIYSTHSPYLIPDTWESVHFVSMGENGTEVDNHSIDSYGNWLKSLTGNDIFNLQEISEKYKRGDTEAIAHRCYDAIIKKYTTVEKAADAIGLETTTLESWRKNITSKKFRSPKLENVLLISHITQTDILHILSH